MQKTTHYNSGMHKSIFGHTMHQTFKWIGCSSRRPICLKHNNYLIKCSLRVFTLYSLYLKHMLRHSLRCFLWDTISETLSDPLSEIVSQTQYQTFSLKYNLSDTVSDLFSEIQSLRHSIRPFLWNTISQTQYQTLSLRYNLSDTVSDPFSEIQSLRHTLRPILWDSQTLRVHASPCWTGSPAPLWRGSAVWFCGRGASCGSSWQAPPGSRTQQRIPGQTWSPPSEYGSASPYHHPWVT